MSKNTKLGILNILILLLLSITNFYQSYFNMTNLNESIFNLTPLFILIILVVISTIMQNLKAFGWVYLITAIITAFLSESGSVAATIFFIFAIMIFKDNIFSVLILSSVIFATILKSIIFSYNNIYIFINTCIYYIGAFWVLLLIQNNNKGGEDGRRGKNS